MIENTTKTYEGYTILIDGGKDIFGPEGDRYEEGRAKMNNVADGLKGVFPQARLLLGRSVDAYEMPLVSTVTVVSPGGSTVACSLPELAI